MLINYHWEWLEKLILPFGFICFARYRKLLDDLLALFSKVDSKQILYAYL